MNPKFRWVYAIDPGETSGYAWWEAPVEGSPRPGPEILMGEMSHMDTLIASDRVLAEHPGPGLVVVESYVITMATLRKTRGDNWSLEQIGALRYLAAKHMRDFELQSPSEAKTFSKNEKLKRLGWYVSGQGGHSNDAARHLLLAMVRHDLIDIRRLT